MATSFAQQFATPLMLSQWNGHGNCKHVLERRSLVERFGANRFPQHVEEADACASGSSSSAAVNALGTTAPGSALRVQSEHADRTVSSRSIASTESKSVGTVALPLPTVSGVSDFGDAGVMQLKWCVFRDGSLSHVPPDPMPLLPLAVRDSSYVELDGVFNTSVYRSCYGSSIPSAHGVDLANHSEPKQRLIQALHAKVDILLNCSRKFSTLMAALAQCSFTSEEVVASQSDLLDGLWTVQHGASAHVASADRAGLLVPPARNWSELIRRAVHWRVSESCLRFLFDKARDECRREDLCEAQVTALALGLSDPCRVMLDEGMLGHCVDARFDPFRTLCALASSEEIRLVRSSQFRPDLMYPECMPAYMELGMVHAAATHGRAGAIPMYLHSSFSPSLLEHRPPDYTLSDVPVLHRALACACLSGNLNAVLAVNESGAPYRIDHYVPQAALDPLTCAVVGGSLKVAAYIIKFLLARPRNGPPVMVPNVVQFAASLVAASRTGRCKMIALLLKSGVSVNAVDFRSPVPVICCCTAGRVLFSTLMIAVRIGTLCVASGSTLQSSGGNSVADISGSCNQFARSIGKPCRRSNLS